MTILVEVSWPQHQLLILFSFLQTCHTPSFVFPPLSSSDHNSLLFIIPLRQHHKPSFKNLPSSWLYSKGDSKTANLILSSLPWDSLLSSNDVNYSWSLFKEVFVEVMNCAIPSKLVPIKNSPPWVNNHLPSCIHKRNVLFTKIKRAKSSSLMSQYRICRNKTLSYQHHLKSTFFHKLFSIFQELLVSL